MRGMQWVCAHIARNSCYNKWVCILVLGLVRFRTYGRWRCGTSNMGRGRRTWAPSLQLSSTPSSGFWATSGDAPRGNRSDHGVPTPEKSARTISLKFPKPIVACLQQMCNLKLAVVRADTKLFCWGPLGQLEALTKIYKWWTYKAQSSMFGLRDKNFWNCSSFPEHCCLCRKFASKVLQPRG